MAKNKIDTILHVDIPKQNERDGFVFISYKREDVVIADTIHKALLKAGFPVWWDQKIQCGQKWSAVLDEAVKQALCIVVLWSPKATESIWVLHEASIAIANDNYSPLVIEECTIPVPYNNGQTKDIIDWDGISDNQGFVNLLERCSLKVPKRKSLWIRMRESSWAFRSTILASLFALVSLGILLWQARTVFVQKQQLDSLFTIQKETVIAQRAFQKLSEATSALANSRFEKLLTKQEESAERFDKFQSQSEERVKLQMQRLNRVFNQQIKSSKELDQFRFRSDTATSRQLRQLNYLITNQKLTALNQEEFRVQTGRDLKQSELNRIINQYTLESVTLEYEVEFSLDEPIFEPYIKRISNIINGGKFIFPAINDERINLTRHTGLFPKNKGEEKKAFKILSSSHESFKLINSKPPDSFKNLYFDKTSNNDQFSFEMDYKNKKVYKIVKKTNLTISSSYNRPLSIIDLAGENIIVWCSENSEIKTLIFSFSNKQTNYFVRGKEIEFEKNKSTQPLSLFDLGLGHLHEFNDEIINRK